ncbi:MAG: transcriptional repressor [Phycisphaerae bacterium]|nr:transcriptional repressor [Phycisphaerae bacterium]
MSESQSKPEDMSAAEAVFRAYLHDRGLKYTPERRMLLEEILRTHEHFEAEQLLIDMRQAGKRVAKATIYRTLPLLVECGIVKQLQLGGKMARYEHVLGHAPHDHLVCRQCGQIIEFDSSQVADLRDAIARQHGFEPSGHRFQIMGLCSNCKKSR